MLFKYEIPITNYYGDGIYHMELYIESNRFLTKIEFLDILWEKHLVDEPEGKEAYKIVEGCKDFPRLNNEMSLATNFVSHHKFGQQCI
jgi:hypothetical protein